MEYTNECKEKIEEGIEKINNMKKAYCECGKELLGGITGDGELFYSICCFCEEIKK